MNHFLKLNLSFDEDFESLYSTCYAKTDLDLDKGFDLFVTLSKMIATDIAPNLYFEMYDIEYDDLPKGFDQNGGSITFLEDGKNVTLYFSPLLANHSV